MPEKKDDTAQPIRKKEIKNLWESQVTSIFEDQDPDGMEDFLSVISIIMDVKFDDNIAKLYSVLNDAVVFTKIINLFSGMTIQFPDREKFKKATTLALTYFYREIKGLDWKEIQKEFPEQKHFSMTGCKGIARLNDKIRIQLEKTLAEFDKKE